MDAAPERPVLVCAGGAGFALDCARHTLPTRLRPEPSSGVRLHGQVELDSPSGREPVPGVWVALHLADLPGRRPVSLPLRLDAEGDSLVRWAMTDGDGRYELPPLAPGRYRIELRTPWGEEQLGEPVEVPPVESASSPADAHLDLGTFVFDPGLRLEFQVTDSGGRPLSDARIGVSQGESGGRSFRAVTDAAGRATLNGLVGQRPVRTSCTAAGHTADRQRFPAPPSLVECVLAAHATLAGLIEGDGDPLDGATITLVSRRADATGRLPTKRVRASDDGAFTFADLDAGIYDLLAAAPGFEPSEIPVELLPGEEHHLPKLELLPALPRHGEVRDAASGEPVARASVLAVEPAGAVHAVSDETGAFSFHQGDGTALVLRITAAGYPPHTRRVEPGRDRDDPLVIDLPRGGHLRVSVWDDAADAPCAGCPVVVDRPRRPGMPEEPALTLTTGPDGTALSPLLAPGPVHVIPEQVRSLGSTVTVRSGNVQQRAEIEADRVTEVRFGHNRQSLLVVFRPPPAPGFHLLADGPNGRETAERRKDGSFVVRRRTGAPLLLRLAASGLNLFQAVVPADFDRPSLEIDLPRTRVTGRLAGEGFGGGHELRALPAGSSVGAWAVSAADGRFVLPHLPPGTYRLDVDGAPRTAFVLGAGEDLDLGELTVGEPTADLR